MRGLIRANNLGIFLVVVTGLIAVAVVQTRHIADQPDVGYLRLIARIVLPVLALVLTGVMTNAIVGAYIRGAPDRPATPTAVAPAFRRAKLVSIISLTAVGVISAACLLFGHRTKDVILAVIPLLLLFVTRVNSQGPRVFAAYVEDRRRAAAHESEAEST